jgi:fibro-slime domain-containing protein
MNRIATKTFGWAGSLLPVLLVLACNEKFDGPFTPESPNYAGADWSDDSDGDGVADSIAKYLPGCGDAPEQCLRNAKLLSAVWGKPHALSSRDMILRVGQKDVRPDLVFIPAVLALRGWILTSSDSSKVMPSDNSLAALAEGSVRITAGLKNDSLAASFAVRVVAGGKPVVSLSARDIEMETGGDAPPDLDWVPADADYKEYFLASLDPSVAIILNNRIRAVSEGSARITVRALDGGAEAAFIVSVSEPSAGVRVDSLIADDVYLVAGSPPAVPRLAWLPYEATNKKYILVTSDSNIVALSKERDLLIPKAEGSAGVTVIALDGGKSAVFTAYVARVPVPVEAVSAQDLVLTLGAQGEAPRVSFFPADASDKSIVVTGGNPLVADYLNGLIRPLGVGSAEFTVTARDGGAQDRFTVTVTLPDTTVHVASVSVEPLSLSVGDLRSPVITWNPPNAPDRRYLLTRKSGASAEAAGEALRAVAEGVSTFELKTLDSGRTAVFQVTVKKRVIPVLSVGVDPILSITLGDPDKSPVLTFNPPTATDKRYTLSSSDSNAVTIVNDTLIHAKAVGFANVRVATSDTATALFRVNVLPSSSTYNARPTAKITAPAPTLLFRGGQVIDFSGTGSDPEDGVLGAAAFTWKVCMVRHGVAGPTGGLTNSKSGSVTIPTTGETTTDIGFRLILLVKDSLGLVGADSLDLKPALVNMTLASNPSGLALSLDGAPVTAPFLFQAVPGFQRQIRAVTPQRLGNRNYGFAAWSDGKALEHAFPIPSADLTVVASFSILVDSLKAAEAALSKGDPDKAPSLTWFPVDAADKRYTLTSLDTSIVTIANGLLHAVKPGIAMVQAASLDGDKTALFRVTVWPPSSFTLTAKLRDVREIPTQSQYNIPSWAHPDFNNDAFMGCGIGETFVDADIRTDGSGDTSVFKGDNRGPKLIRTVSRLDGKACYTSIPRFDEWYNDKDTSVNRPFLLDLAFTRMADGTYDYNNQAFFPLDSQVPGPWYNLPGKNLVPYGHLSTGNEALHNFGFTMEFHGVFTYKAGTGQMLDFTGDDDAWAYLNGKLAINLGGVHAPLNASANLDAMAGQLGLIDGKTYPLDFFFAERHANRSTFHLVTNLVVEPR